MPKTKANASSLKRNKRMLVIATTGSNPYSMMYHLTLKHVDYFTWAEYKKHSISLLDYQIIALEIDRMYVPEISEEIFNGWVLSIISELKDLISRDQVVLLFGNLSVTLKLRDGKLSSLPYLINKHIQIRTCKNYCSHDVQLMNDCSIIKEYKDIFKLHPVFDHCFDFSEGAEDYINIFNIKSTQTSVGCAFRKANTSFIYLPALSAFGNTEKTMPQFFGQEENFKDDNDLQRLKLEKEAYHFDNDEESGILYQTLEVLFDIGKYFLEHPIEKHEPILDFKQGNLNKNQTSVAQDNEGEHKFPYKLPAGTRWENISIKFLDDENVLIKVKQFEQNANFFEIGFIGRGKNPKPSESWTFLNVLAKRNGELTINDHDARDKYKKQKELLAKVLQNYFSLDYDPFYPYRSSPEKEGNSYKIKLTLIPLQSRSEQSDMEEEESDDLKEEYLPE